MVRLLRWCLTIDVHAAVIGGRGEEGSPFGMGPGDTPDSTFVTRWKGFVREERGTESGAERREGSETGVSLSEGRKVERQT